MSQEMLKKLVKKIKKKGDKSSNKSNVTSTGHSYSRTKSKPNNPDRPSPPNSMPVPDRDKEPIKMTQEDLENINSLDTITRLNATFEEAVGKGLSEFTFDNKIVVISKEVQGWILTKKNTLSSGDSKGDGKTEEKATESKNESKKEEPKKSYDNVTKEDLAQETAKAEAKSNGKK